MNAAGFLKCLTEGANKPAADQERQGLSSLLIEQVEFANVVLLNKMDLVNDQEMNKLTAIISKLNPGATILKAEHCNVPVAAVLRTKRCVACFLQCTKHRTKLQLGLYLHPYQQHMLYNAFA